MALNVMENVPDSPQHPSITRQTRNGDPNVIIDPYQFLLVRRKFTC